SPLRAPGVDVREGDRVLAVDGTDDTPDRKPAAMLGDKGWRPHELRLRGGRRRAHTGLGTTRSDEIRLRCREWDESKRSRVAEATDGRAGYIHIPDMGPVGFAEFHRSLLTEVDRDGLVIDVRFNRGGNVSQLLLERLLRRRLGWELGRWRVPVPF